MPESVWLWSPTAADNNDADDGINYSEGQSPGSLNNSARAAMAAIAKHVLDTEGALTLAGGTTAYTLTTNQGLAALVDGRRVHAVVNATNTGASTLNVDTRGAKAIVIFTDAGETALAAGDMIAGEHAVFQYDASAAATAGAWVLINPHPRQATQAQMEAATSNGVNVTPGRVQNHPGVVKCWVQMNGTGTIAIATSYNVSGLVDNATGNYTVTIGTDMSGSNYCVLANNNNAVIANGSSSSAGAFSLLSRNIAGSLADSNDIYAAALGDQ